MWLELIAIGSVWFWLIIAAAVILEWIFLEREAIGGVIATTILATLAIFLLAPMKGALFWVLAHPLLCLGAIAIYLVAGVIYSIVKWDRFYAGIQTRYEELKTRWLDSDGHNFQVGQPFPPELKAEWTIYLKDLYPDKSTERIKEYALKGLSYYNYKSLITAWAIWWPISFSWLLINDPIRKIAEWSVEQLKSVYIWIGERHRKSLVNEIETSQVVLRKARDARDNRR